MLNVVLLLIIYSFLGWIVECTYCVLGTGVWINRGFLYGPFIPIYGFGAVLVLGAINYLPNNIFIIFLGSIIITSILEYLTSYLMELLFHTRWWDYSELPFNLNGRICLLNSLLFGVAFVVVYYLINPQIMKLLNQFSYEFKLGFLTAAMLYFTIDFIISVKSALHLTFKLETLRNIRLALIDKYHHLEHELNLSQIEIKLHNHNDELINKFRSLKSNLNRFEKRLIKAFPTMKASKYQKAINELKKTIK